MVVNPIFFARKFSVEVEPRGKSKLSYAVHQRKMLLRTHPLWGVVVAGSSSSCLSWVSVVVREGIDGLDGWMYVCGSSGQSKVGR